MKMYLIQVSKPKGYLKTVFLAGTHFQVAFTNTEGKTRKQPVVPNEIVIVIMHTQANVSNEIPKKHTIKCKEK